MSGIDVLRSMDAVYSKVQGRFNVSTSRTDGGYTVLRLERYTGGPIFLVYDGDGRLIQLKADDIDALDELLLCIARAG